MKFQQLCSKPVRMLYKRSTNDDLYTISLSDLKRLFWKLTFLQKLFAGKKHKICGKRISERKELTKTKVYNLTKVLFLHFFQEVLLVKPGI